jgi:hypothetical protein
MAGQGNRNQAAITQDFIRRIRVGSEERWYRGAMRGEVDKAMVDVVRHEGAQECRPHSAPPGKRLECAKADSERIDRDPGQIPQPADMVSMEVRDDDAPDVRQGIPTS